MHAEVVTLKRSARSRPVVQDVDKVFGRGVALHARRMRGVLDELVAAAAPWREKEIAATLGLDRSVVGRLVRASRAGTDLELLSELQSAEG